MIAPTPPHLLNYLSELENRWRILDEKHRDRLRSIIEASIYGGGRGERHHGVSRRDPDTYRVLTELQGCGLITRQGYQYYATVLGVRYYFQLKDRGFKPYPKKTQLEYFEGEVTTPQA